METIKKKIAIKDEIYIFIIKSDNHNLCICIYKNNNPEIPLIEIDNIKFENINRIEMLRNKILIEFIKLNKKYHEDIQKVKEKLLEFINYNIDRLDTTKNTKSSNNLLKNLISSEVFGIMIYQNDKLLSKYIVDSNHSEKIDSISKYILQTLTNIKRDEDIYMINYLLSNYQIVVSPLDKDIVAILITDNKDMINIIEKYKHIFSKIKQLIAKGEAS